MLKIYIDFKCPASYLSYGPNVTLAERLNIKIDWAPFSIAPPTIPPRQPDETKGDMHRRVRAEQQRNIHLKYASLRGVEMNFRARPHQTDMALSALLAPLASPEDYIAHAFEAYWREGLDLNDAGTVEHLLIETNNQSVVGTLSGLSAKADEHQHASEDAGIFQTPCYILEEQIFIGREHLPLIEKLLRDRSS